MTFIKNTYLILAFIVGTFSANLFAQCPLDNVWFSTQAEVDDFAINYPNCTNFEFDINILEGNITNLQAFSQLESIEQLILSTANNLLSFEGLENLQTVTTLLISGNGITSTVGLENLHTCGWISFENMDNLLSINLPGLTAANNILISGCDYLQTIQLDNLIEIAYGTGWNNSNSGLYVLGNDSLTELSMASLVYIETLRLRNSPILTNINAPDLSYINEDLDFVNCGLSDMTSFSSVQEIGEDLEISSHLNLTTLQGFDNLQFIGGLIIQDNPFLSFCSIDPVCNYIEAQLSYEIDNNEMGCLTGDEILLLCSNEPDCNDLDFTIQSITPTACPPDSLQPDVCLNVCPFNSQVYTVSDADQAIEWNVIGAETFEVVGNELIVEWGGAGSGLITAIGTVNQSGSNPDCDMYVVIRNDNGLHAEVYQGTFPYAIEWTDTNGNSIYGPYTPGQEGTYILEVIDALGCVYTEEITLPLEPDCDNNKITILADITPATNCDSSDGLIEIQISGGQPPYTYNWDTETILENLAVGTYDAVVTDANGCSETRGLFVPCTCEAPAVEITVGPCGRLDIGPLPNEIIFNVEIRGENGYLSSGQSHIGLKGTYEIYSVTDVCPSSFLIEINNDITPIFDVQKPSFPGACDGYIRVVDPNADYFYDWGNGNDSATQLDVCCGVEHTMIITGQLQACLFKFNLSCDGEVCDFELSQCVDILEEVEAIISTTPEAVNGEVNICAGQTVYFESESINAETYEWDFGNGENSSGNTTEFIYDIAGSYLVQLIARNECLCADTTSLTVNVDQAIIPQLDCVGTVCEGTEVTYTTDAECSAYSWEISGDGLITNGGGNSDNFVTIDWGAGPLGTITLSVTGCTEDYCIQENITQIPIIGNNDAIKGPTEVCKGDLEVYTITNYGGSDFLWEVSPFGTIVEGQGTNTVSVQWTDLTIPNGPQWVRVTYENCYLECGGMAELEVNILDEFFFSGPIELCINENGTYEAEKLSGGPAIVNWALFDITGAEIQSATSTATFTINLSGAIGIYSIEATPPNATAFCSENYRAFINLLDIPVPVTGIEGETQICLGSTYTYEALTTVDNTSFVWTINDGGNIETKQGRYVNIAWSSSGPYQLDVYQVENSEAACESESISLSLTAIDQISISGATSSCIETNTILTATDYESVDYEWEVIPADAATIISGQNTSAAEFFWHTEGNVTVQLNACASVQNYVVEVYGNPIPVVNHPAELCVGGEELISTTTNFVTYDWRGENGATISTNPTVMLGAGFYELIVTNDNGCEDNVIFDIVEIPSPEVDISSPNLLTYCPASGFGVPTLFAMETVPPFQYQWYRNGVLIPGATGANYTPPSGESGNYTVEATDDSGCISLSNDLDVLLNCGPGGPPAELQCQGVGLSFDIENTTFCNQHKFTNTSTNFIPGSTFWWFGFPEVESTGTGDNTSYEFERAGYYVVVMFANFNNNGNIETCGLAQLDVIPVAPNFTALPGCVDSPIQFEDLSTYIAGEGVAAWSWDFGEPGSANNTSADQHPTHDYSSAGSFDVTLIITSLSGCTSERTKTIEVEDYPTFFFDLPNVDCQNIAIDFTAVIPNTVVDIEWDFGDPSSGDANTSNVVNTYHQFMNPGTYTITLTAMTIYGCEKSFSHQFEVTQNNLSGLINMSPGSPICEGDNTTLTGPAGGTGYSWSNAQNGPSIVVSEAGSYDVTVTDANGCIYIAPDEILDVLPVPQGEIRVVEYDEYGQPILFFYDDYTICEGDEVFMEINEVGGYNYDWSNGQSGTINDFTIDRDNLLETGTHDFEVTITDATTGCTNIVGPFTVTVNAQPGPIVLTSAPGGYVCDNEPVTITISNYDPDLTYVWNTGTIDATALIIDIPGTYFVRGINANGCETTSNEILVNPGPDLNRIPAGCHKQCTPDTLCLPDMPTITNWQWYFNDVAIPAPEGTVEELVATESGDYYVVMEDVNGCVATSGIMSLDLFVGLGSVVGSVYFDVNDNGIIDAGDTVVDDQMILIDGANYNSSTASGLDGTYSFDDISSTTYDLTFDPQNLPPGWSVVQANQSVELIGCDDVETIDWLLTNSCQPENLDLTLQACTGSTVVYNGTTLNPNDVQGFSFTNVDGCDSIVTVTVEEVLHFDEILNEEACTGSFYDYNGEQIPAGGSQVFEFITTSGCDSMVTVNVAEVLSFDETINEEACAGSFYEYNGEQIPAGGSQVFEFITTSGCDSVITVNVAELLGYEEIITATACSGEDFIYNGEVIPAGATQVFNNTTTNGCDSTVTVTVAEIFSTNENIDFEECDGEAVNYNGITIEAGTSHQFDLTNFEGCDSTLIVTVVAIPLWNISIEMYVCENDSLFYQGEYLYPNNNYEFILQSSFGCDSIEQVAVLELGSNPITLNEEICEGTTFVYNDIEYPAGTSEIFTYQSSQGCDSTIQLNVTAAPTFAYTYDTETICYNELGFLEIGEVTGNAAPYTYAIDGINFQDNPAFTNIAGGDYTLYVSDNNGCIKTIPANIPVYDRLNVDVDNVAMTCDIPFVEIGAAVTTGMTEDITFVWPDGTSGESYNASQDGFFVLEVSNLCENKSINFQVAPAVSELENYMYVPNVFSPNEDGNNDFFMVSPANDAIIHSYEIHVFSRWGEELYESFNYNDGWDGKLKNGFFNPGVYVWWIEVDVTYCGTRRTIFEKGDISIIR